MIPPLVPSISLSLLWNRKKWIFGAGAGDLEVKIKNAGLLSTALLFTKEIKGCGVNGKETHLIFSHHCSLLPYPSIIMTQTLALHMVFCRCYEFWYQWIWFARHHQHQGSETESGLWWWLEKATVVFQANLTAWAVVWSHRKLSNLKPIRGRQGAEELIRLGQTLCY